MRMLALLGACLLATGWVAALDLGDDAPPLHMTLVTGDQAGEEIELIDESDGDCLLFLAYAGSIDQRAGDLVGILEAVYRETKDDPDSLMVVAAVIGPAGMADQIRQAVQENELTLPVALVDPASEDLDAWTLPQEFTAGVAAIEEGRIEAAFDNPEKLRKWLEEE